MFPKSAGGDGDRRNLGRRNLVVCENFTEA
jgi:hypothetical protein